MSAAVQSDSGAQPAVGQIHDESLAASEWARLLGVSTRAIQMKGIADSGSKQMPGGQIARVYRFADLPPVWREALLQRLESEHAATFSGLLRAGDAGWQPARKFTTYPAATQEKAYGTREVMMAYYTALDAGQTKKDSARIAQSVHTRIFGKSCSAKKIFRWEERIEKCGGAELAPLEAYVDQKSVPHPGRRLANRVPEEFVTEYRARCVRMERLTDAHRSLEIDWLMGQEIPGLGCRNGSEPFPFSAAQLRKFAPTTAARRLGSHGKARARREALPHMETTSSCLRRAEQYVLDDSRVDIIATDDLTGAPVELTLYLMMDRGPRRIEGWTVRQSGRMRRADVSALVARVLRSCGVAPAGAGYRTTIKFERGTVACPPAQQTLLESAFPGRLAISRTSMDGGKNFPGAPTQMGSGHWMGKADVESMMRTFAFFISHIPGQRGGTYARQPAQLGLRGKNRERGSLEYSRGSEIHEAALLNGAGRALEFIEDNLESRIAAWKADGCARHGERLKVRSLRPVSWVLDAIATCVMYYNQRTDHRLEGFRRIEYQDEQGRRKFRMESPNERAQYLASICQPERLSAADAAALIRTQSRTVRVTRQGVSFTLDGVALRFWHPDSVTVAEALRLATGEKRSVAVFDPEELLHGRTPEIYLLTETGPNWRPGDPARFVEALPLYERKDKLDPEAMARGLADHKRVESRIARELLSAAAPSIAERLAEAEENTSVMRGVMTSSVNTSGETLASLVPFPAQTKRAESPGPNGGETRRDQQRSAEDRLADLLADYTPDQD